MPLHDANLRRGNARCRCCRRRGAAADRFHHRTCQCFGGPDDFARRADECRRLQSHSRVFCLDSAELERAATHDQQSRSGGRDCANASERQFRPAPHDHGQPGRAGLRRCHRHLSQHQHTAAAPLAGAACPAAITIPQTPATPSSPPRGGGGGGGFSWLDLLVLSWGLIRRRK